MFIPSKRDLIFSEESIPSVCRLGPPPFGLSRPLFYPSPFMPSPQPNLFMMHPRFPMPTAVPHGTTSPIQHLIVNSNEMNSTEMVNSSDITPNSISCDGQVDGMGDSPATHGEHDLIPSFDKN